MRSCAHREFPKEKAVLNKTDTFRYVTDTKHNIWLGFCWLPSPFIGVIENQLTSTTFKPRACA